MKIKNISGSYLEISKIGRDLEIDEVLDLDYVDINAIRKSSSVLVDLISSGSIVYMDVDGVTQLSTSDSQDLQEVSSGVLNVSTSVITEIGHSCVGLPFELKDNTEILLSLGTNHSIQFELQDGTSTEISLETV